MKKRKIAKMALAVLSVLTIGAAGASLAACGGGDKHSHKYGDWQVVGTPPSLTSGGKAEHYCTSDDGAKETKDLPVLTDGDFWTEDLDAKVEATHITDGSRTFTSDYVTVTITVDKTADDHAWGDWKLTKEPTYDAVGIAERVCKKDGADHKEEKKDIPALSDKSFWTEKVTKDPTCKEDGKGTYVNATYKFEVKDAKIPVKADAHDWGAWTIVGDEPNFEHGGKIKHVCKNDSTHYEEKDIPALTDNEFWAENVKFAPTHKDTGISSFVNKEYDIAVLEVKTPKAKHTFGDWVMTKEPKLNEKGEATRTCSEGDCAEEEDATETKQIESLSDTSVWTKGVPFEADYTHPAGVTYTSIYGSVTVYEGEKLPAPYDGKTYYSVEIYLNEDTNNVSKYAWSTAALTVGQNGEATGDAHPFRGNFVIEFTDVEKGLIKLTDTSDNSSTDAYVDEATGIIVMQKDGSWSGVFVAIPNETAAVAADFKASACAGDLIIAYAKDDVELNILVTHEGVIAGVEVTDIYGNPVDAGTCFDLEENVTGTVFLRDAEGKVIKGYGYNFVEEKWVVADGLEGAYANSDGKNVLINGAAGVMVMQADGETLFGQGNYEIISNTAESKIIGAILYNTEYEVVGYFEYTLSGDGMSEEGGTCTQAEPKVTITYDFGEYTPTNADDINVTNEVPKAIPYTLAVPEHATMQFKGWTTEDGEDVEADYAPTADVTLYAKWVSKIVINVSGLLEADADKDKIYLGEGDVIGDYLLYEKYNLNEDGTQYFEGWYMDEEFNTPLDLTIVLGEEANNQTIYAHWVAVPAYVGTYYGSNTYNKNSCNSLSNPLTISIEGKITGKYTGQVESYDPETQLMTVTISGTTRYFVFDKDSGVLATGNSETKCTNPLSYDMDTYSSERPKASLGLKVNGSYDTYVIDIVNKCGTSTILFYGNKIYANVTVTNAIGQPLTAATALNSKTIVVTNNATGNAILEVQSKGNNFNANQEVEAIAGDYGAYTNGDDKLLIDGAGSFGWNGKIGTYTKDGNSLDMYVVVDGKNTEYWQVTLGEGKTFTADKPTTDVTVTAKGPDGAALSDTIPTVAANINVGVIYSLPDANAYNADYYFSGYYKDEACTEAVDETLIANEEVTVIYAKYSALATVTLVFNDGETANEVIRYADGATATIERPVYAKHAHVGWFTKDGTEDGDWGDEWTNGSAVSEGNLTIYAKWEDAPLYSDDYTLVMISGTSLSGGTSSLTNYSAASISVDPYGNAPASSYPLGSAVEIKYTDKANNKLSVKSGSNSFNYAVIDPETGLIVMASNEAMTSSLYLLSNKETGDITSHISSSYWNSGKNRAIQYNDGTTTHNIYIAGGNVYFGVSFKDAATGGNDIVGADCYKAAALYVIAKDGTVLEQPDITVTFNYNGHGGENNTITINKFFAQNLNVDSLKPTATGFVFRGWYTDEGLTSQASNSYVTGENATLYAKWDAQATVNFHYNDTDNDTPHTAAVYSDAYVNDKIGSANIPAVDFMNGEKAFVNWFTKDGTEDGDWGVAVTADTVISGTTVEVYAKWISPAAMMGTYNGVSISGTGSGTNKAVTSQSNQLTISAIGDYVYGSSKGTLSEADMTKTVGEIHLASNYYAYIDKSIGLIWRGNSTTGITNSSYLLFNTELINKVTNYSYVANWQGALVWATIELKDGTNINLFGYNNVIYKNVSWGDITADKCKDTTHIVYAENGTMIAAIKDGKVAELDGYQGAYTLDGTTNISIDGLGSIRVGSSDYDAYTVEDGKLHFVHNNQMHVLSVNKTDNTAAYEQDGYAGEYTLPEGAGTIELDGLGKVKNTDKTYVVTGTSIAIYNGENVAKYGIDVDKHEFIGKSIFAGLKFKHGTGSTDWIEFDDSSSISGVMWFTASYSHPSSYDGGVEFTGVINKNKLTITITKQKSGSPINVNKTLVFTVANGKLTLDSASNMNSDWEVRSNWVYSCADFNFAG